MSEWLRDLGYGFRLAVGGSRGSATGWVRLGLGAFGIAIVVAVLLGAASASTVMAEREARQLAQAPMTEPVDGVAPTYLGMVFTSYRGTAIHGTLVRHEDASSPVPPGVSRQLDAGELVVSPALAELLSSPEGELLLPRFAGYRIVGTLGKPGLVEPDDVRFVAGSDAIEAATKTVDGQTLTDPAYRAYGFGGDIQRHPLPVELLALVALATAALLVPLLIFIVSSARIAGAERDRRLAALRLVGGDAAQVRRIAAGEALLPAAAGLVAGGALFLTVRPLAEQVQLFGVGVFADDIAPSWWPLALIVLGVPMLSVGAALLAMRRTVIEPLGVVRQGKTTRRRLWWRLVTLAVGIGVLAYAAPAATNGDSMVIGIVAGAGLLVIGIATLLPWAVEVLISGLRGGTPALQLAARRLQLDSGTSARVISGVVVVLTGAIALLLTMTSTQRDIEAMNALADGGPSAESFSPVMWVGGRAETLSVLAGRLRELPEIEEVHRAQNYEIEVGQAAVMMAVVGDCFVLAAVADVDGCSDGSVFVSTAGSTGPSAGETVRLRGSGETSAAFVLPPNTGVALPYDFMEGLLITPQAMAASAEKPEGVDTLYLETAGGDVREGSDLIERVRNAAGLSPDVHVGFAVYVDPTDDEETFASIKATIYAGSTIVLVLAALSVLVLAVEQVRERRRALAAVSAGGVGFGTLARSLLWQNAIPIGIGAVFALLGGILLAHFVLRIANSPLVIDWTAVGGLVAIAVASVLFVTLLSMPVLRAAVSVKNLRTE